MMKEQVKTILEELIRRYPTLEAVREDIAGAYQILKDSYDAGGKLLVAGNGGSCADSEHIVGELMKGFCKKRPVDPTLVQRIREADPCGDKDLAGVYQQPMTAIALTGHTALTTAFANDVDGEYAMAQQLLGYGKAGDVFLGITTSGNSRNILHAAAVAKALGIPVLILAGRDGGAAARMADCAIVVPERETFKIQELHLPIYHALCLMLEETYFAQ